MSEALTAHRALESAWTRLYAAIDGARFEPRSDLYVAVWPGFPLPPFNGAWVAEDSPVAAAGLSGAIAEVEAAGERAWVLTRRGQERTQAAAAGLGFTVAERLPAMVLRPGELGEPTAELEIGPVEAGELEQTVTVLAGSFGTPGEIFARFGAILEALPEATWYVGRMDGRVVSTAVGMTTGGATGIFNVATPPEHRRRGYGAALTARAARDGFAAGAGLAYLQSSELGRGVYRGLGFREVDEYVVLARPG